jgi:hypothetical protein
LPHTVIKHEFIGQVLLEHFSGLAKARESMGVAKIPDRIRNKPRCGMFIDEKQPAHGPPDLLTHLSKANLRRIGGDCRTVDRYRNSMQQSQCPSLDLLNSLAFRDIFEHDTDTIAGKRKAIEPKYAVLVTGIRTSHFTYAFRFTASDHRAAANGKVGAHERGKRFGNNLAHRFARGHSQLSLGGPIQIK